MAIALILFCVFQVMTALSNATATSSLSSLLPNTTLPVAADMATDPEDKHGKRSLNAFPFESKYIGTETMTLEILQNGTVRGIRNLYPSYGIMHFTLACMMKTITPSLDKKENQNYGKVSLKWNKSNRYLCMNDQGYVYSSLDCSDECEFKQKIENNDNHILYSLKYSGPRPRQTPFKNDKRNKKRRNKKWYLAIDRKTGEMLPGWRTRKRKKNAQFVPRPSIDHGYKETRYSITTTSDPNVLKKVSLDPQGSVSVEVNTEDEFRDNEKNFFKDPTSQNSKSKQRPSINSKRGRKRPKQKEGSHRHGHGTNKRAQDCDQTADPLNLFRLNKNCRRKTSRNTKNLGGSVPFSSTAFNNQNVRGATSNPAQRRTSRANLFSFSPKR